MLGIPDASHSPSLTYLLMRVDICARMSFISACIHASHLSARRCALIMFGMLAQLCMLLCVLLYLPLSTLCCMLL